MRERWGGKAEAGGRAFEAAARGGAWERARACVLASVRGRGPQHAVREADVRAGWAGAGAVDEMAEGGGCRERPDAETQKSELGALMRTTLQRGAQW